MYIYLPEEEKPDYHGQVKNTAQNCLADKGIDIRLYEFSVRQEVKIENPGLDTETVWNTVELIPRREDRHQKTALLVDTAGGRCRLIPP